MKNAFTAKPDIRAFVKQLQQSESAKSNGEKSTQLKKTQIRLPGSLQDSSVNAPRRK